MVVVEWVEGRVFVSQPSQHGVDGQTDGQTDPFEHTSSRDFKCKLTNVAFMREERKVSESINFVK